jgi:hypothetical protein
MGAIETLIKALNKSILRDTRAFPDERIGIARIAAAFPCAQPKKRFQSYAVIVPAGRFDDVA